MFDYPLSLNADTHYGRLSLTPDATSADIRNAKTELANAIAAQVRQFRARLSTVESAVPELAERRQEVKTLREAESPDPATLKEAQRALAAAERRAVAIDPGYVAALEEIEKLDRKLNEINSITLEDEEARRRYDLNVPPCALLKLSEHREPLLENRRAMLAAVRRTLSAFIEDELGRRCFHPTDETRRDFNGDFEPNDTLDRGRP